MGVRSVAFGLILLHASILIAGNHLRPFVKDVGLFDPSGGPVKVSFELRKDANLVEVAVENFRNQVVRHFNFVQLRAGDHDVVWDGKGEEGHRLAEGAYKMLFHAKFKDGSHDGAEVNVRLASVAAAPGVNVPEALPPEMHPYQIEGSVASFWRCNSDRDKANTEGELRIRNRFSFMDDTRKLQAVLAVIKPLGDGDANYDGSHAMLEQQWGPSRLIGVFREGLGSFDDPMKLFSDFRSERKKYGIKLEQTQGFITTRALVFQSERDVNNNEQGVASRAVLGRSDGWRIGSSYTYRKGRVDEQQNNIRNHSMAFDAHIPISEPLAAVAETVFTRDSHLKNDFGYLLGGAYCSGQLRFSGSYIDLGEKFEAPFADPLRRVRGDARGLEANLDYSLKVPGEYLTGPTLTMRFFDLKRHSDNSRIREIDTSMRMGIGDRSSYFLSWLGRKEGAVENHSFLNTLNHQWNDVWSSRLEGSYAFSDLDRAWRLTLNTDFRREDDMGRFSLEWIDRRVDFDRQSPFREAALRLDYDRENWGFQLHTRYSQNESESGINFLGRLEYRSFFLHRYRVIAYTSVGNRAATSFEKQVEFGMEMFF
jgi:hypothetical protein